MTALTAAGVGLRTIVLEEHTEIGTPTHCSGKLQVHAFREFNLPAHLIVNTLQAGAFYAPDGTVARVRRAHPDSHVVDRATFDRWLSDQAQAQGAELRLGVRVRAAERLNGIMRVTGERAGGTFSLTAPLIVDAEGARPVLPRSLGMRLERRAVLGLQYQMRDVDVASADCPEIYLGSTVAPGFFGWLMPIGGRRARVGVCVDPQKTSSAPMYYLARLMRDHPVASRRLQSAVVERKLAGPIPILTSRGRTVTDGMIVVGDAAGQVKATSGGGIYFALIAGRLAGQAASAYVGGDRGALSRYERAWRRQFGRELRATAMARLAINEMTDAEVNAFIGAIARDDTLRMTIERLGDTAFQSRLLPPIAARALHPAHLRQLASPVFKLLRHGLRAWWADGLPAQENAPANVNG